MSQPVTTPVQNTPAAAPTNGAKPATQPGKTDPVTPATTAAAEAVKRKLKIAGVERELTQDEIDRLAMQAGGADQRFQEAAEMRRRAEEILKQADEDPAGFFNKRGKDVRKWAEDYLMEELKREQMNPEQKKAFENEQKLKQYEKEKKDAEDQRKKDEFAAKFKEHNDNYNTLFVEALGKAGLPKTAYTVKRMAELQLVNLKKKFNLNADQLAKLVREDYISEQKALYGGMEGDQLLDILGPDIVKKLSKAQIAKLKAKGVRTAPNTANQVRQTDDGRPPGMSDWRWYQMKNRRRAA